MRFLSIILIIAVFQARFVFGSHFKLTNVACRCYDRNYCEFTQCKLNLQRRGLSTFSMYCVLHQTPVDNIYINLELFNYMRNPRAYLFFNTFHKTFASVTNFNHTCPYDHDIIIDRFAYKKDTMVDLPMPNGDYLLYLKLSVSKVWRAELKLYVTRSD